ncbi:hypothetical protein OG306_33325 [Streptomyces sp. NBC_01241]|uniref:hypothetical protein n=1 Tax=Streptomyces sp. NBC_01241 TaxID=2903794 RepID=UPI00352BF7D2|nr:hypothetical protein OG306_33325 [Streptomyces sp. NBC_01241]
MDTNTLTSRDLIGSIHFMKQLQREYNFPINVFQEDEHGNRTLLRVEPAGI